MFESLTKRLTEAFGKLTGVGKIREGNIEEAVRDVKLSLLEADVNYRIVGELVEGIRKKALGSRVLESLTPYQHFIGIVNEELVNLFELPGISGELNVRGSDLTKIMLVGLQGSGKTTTAGKLAKFINKHHGFKPLLVPLDTKRAAAVSQLSTIGEALGIPVFDIGSETDPVRIAKKAVEYASEHSFKLVIFDTAGRLHIDEELMGELSRLEREISFDETLFVGDSMTGQDAVNIAGGFSERLNLTGIILTKMDGDARGGAALSIVSIVKKPIKFIGVGEKSEALEPFHPDRVVSRILGMGDVVTLFEKTREAVEREDVERLEEKIRSKSFTIEDFVAQLKQIQKIGSLETILDLIPGVSKLLKGKDLHLAEAEFRKIEAITNSMTRQEKVNHALLNGRRRLRIAKGSGTSVQDVNRFVKQFMQTKKMMQRFGSMNPRDIMRKGFSVFN